MAGEVRVVEDGAEQQRRSPQSPDSPSWAWMLVGLLVGLGASILFINAAPDETPLSQDSPSPTLGETVPTFAESASEETPGTVGIAAAVESFPDTLVAVVRDSGSTLHHLTWPVSGEPGTDSLAGFASELIRFDASSRVVAIASDVPGASGKLLSMGVPRRVWPVATDVTGFSWHDDEPGLIAFTEVVDDEVLLWTADSSLEPQLVTRGVGLGQSVAAWGDWGFAIQGEGQVVLLTPSGDLRTRVAGRALDSDPSGWLVVAEGSSLRLVSSGGGVDRFDVDLDVLGEVHAAEISPDRSKVVVAGEEGHLILKVDGEPILTPVGVGYPQLSWSSDSRYVLSPSLAGVLIVDTELDGRSQRELAHLNIIAVATVPLTER